MKNIELNICCLEEINNANQQEIQGGIKILDVSSIWDAAVYTIEQVFQLS